jgi:ATP-dependent helicase HrpB
VSQAMGLTIEESPASGEKLRRCILAGFSDHLARRLDGGTLRCRLSGGRGGSIGRESVVRDRSLVVAAEIKEIGRTDGEVEVMLGLVSAVEEDWLREMFPADFSESRGLVFEESGRRVLQVEARKFRDLILEERKRDVEAGPETAQVLAQAVLDKKCVWPGWSAEADRLVERLEVVRGWSAGEEWPEWNQEAQRPVLQRQCQGCLTWRQANERSAVGAMQDWLGRKRIQRMGELAPDRVEIAGGKSLKIEYGKGREPRVSGKIQDFYGWEKTPRIGDGQVELTLEILGPNRRPLQVTKDLGSFWRETYPKLKAELARKYPKHEWR